MTLLETITEIETRGLVPCRLGKDQARNVRLIRAAKRTFINEGAVTCFVESQHAEPETSTETLDDVAPENADAEGYEISQKDWETLHSVDSGNGADIDPLDIDWLRKAGLVEEAAGGVSLTRMAKDWIHGNFTDDEPTSDEERRTI